MQSIIKYFRQKNLQQMKRNHITTFLKVAFPCLVLSSCGKLHFAEEKFYPVGSSEERNDYEYYMILKTDKNKYKSSKNSEQNHNVSLRLYKNINSGNELLVTDKFKILADNLSSEMKESSKSVIVVHLYNRIDYDITKEERMNNFSPQEWKQLADQKRKLSNQRHLKQERIYSNDSSSNTFKLLEVKNY